MVKHLRCSETQSPSRFRSPHAVCKWKDPSTYSYGPHMHAWIHSWTRALGEKFGFPPITRDHFVLLGSAAQRTHPERSLGKGINTAGLWMLSSYRSQSSLSDHRSLCLSRNQKLSNLQSVNFPQIVNSKSVGGFEIQTSRDLVDSLKYKPHLWSNCFESLIWFNAYIVQQLDTNKVHTIHSTAKSPISASQVFTTTIRIQNTINKRHQQQSKCPAHRICQWPTWP